MKSVILFTVILLIAFALLMALPAIHIDSGAVISSNAFSYVRAALYFIPAGTCAAILAIIMGLWIFRVIIALVKTLWAVLPVNK